MRFLISHYLELYQSLIQQFLSVYHYPVTEMSQLDSGDSIFCLSEQGISDVSEAIELYEEALNQVRTELTDWVDSVSSKNQEIRDILVMLLKPIRNRFTFHFILNGHTNTISAPSLYILFRLLNVKIFELHEVFSQHKCSFYYSSSSKCD